ncbi:WD-40 repeat protein, partial [Reticulomyxa filosa]
VNFLFYPAVFVIFYHRFDDCQFFCFRSDDTTVCVWYIDNDKQIQSFNGHSSYMYCVKFSSYHYHSHRQNVICSSSYDDSIRFWDFKHNNELQIFNEYINSVYGIELSLFNGGRYLCSGSGDKIIRLWDVETSKSLHIFNGHEKNIWCVDISPLQSNNNNKMNNIGHKDFVKSVKYGSNELLNTILSGLNDKSVRLWDIRYGKQIQVFNGHIDQIFSVEYSPFVIKSSICNPNVICSESG